MNPVRARQQEPVLKTGKKLFINELSSHEPENKARGLHEITLASKRTTVQPNTEDP